MLGWFHALMPREERFFDLFAAHSRTLTAGAEALAALLESPASEVARHSQTINERESEADAITRDVLIAVRRTFITPIDRGDIQILITAMDDAIDQMQKTAKSITLYEVGEFPPQMKGMGACVVEAAKLVSEAIPLLRNIGRDATRIAAIAEDITKIEGRADDLHEDGLRILFQTHRASGDVMGFAVGRIIYEHLEGVVDRFDDIANEINAIVIEHV